MNFQWNQIRNFRNVHKSKSLFLSTYLHKKAIHLQVRHFNLKLHQYVEQHTKMPKKIFLQMAFPKEDILNLSTKTE